MEQQERAEDPYVAYSVKITKELKDLLNYDIRKVHLRIGEYLDTVREVELYKKAGFSDFDEWLEKTIGWKPSRARMIINNHRILQRLEIEQNTDLGRRLRAAGWYKLHILLSVVTPEMPKTDAISLITKMLNDGLSERKIQSMLPKKRATAQDAGLPEAAIRAWRKLQDLYGQIFKAMKTRDAKKVEALMPRLVSTSRRCRRLTPAPRSRRAG